MFVIIIIKVSATHLNKHKTLLQGETTMKKNVSRSIFTTFRILGSAWFSFLVSIVPLYIWRSTHIDDKFAENIIMSVIAVLFGFLFVMVFQMKDEQLHRYSKRDNFVTSVGGVGTYMLLCILLYLPTKNNFLIAVLGTNLIATGEDGYPTFFAMFASTLVFRVIYFIAIFVGTKIAYRRQSRLLKELINNK